MENDQALDFTHQFSDSPVLDLSCKKNEEPISYSLSPPSSDNRSPSPPSEIHVDNNQSHRHMTFNDDQKSPYEGRTYMVTPPSDSESPMKQRYHTSSYPQLNSPPDDLGHRYSMLPMNFPVQMAPTLPSHIITQQNSGANVRQMHIPITPTSSVQDISTAFVSPDMGKKTPRPFKAYPKDPLSLTMGPELIYDQNSNEAYSEFRKRMLESVRRTNEGTNIKMRRVSKSPSLPTSTMDGKDDAYWERRRKNNEAAKRSRDARRAKEDEIAIRAAFLEQENLKLKCELVALRQEHAKLRCIVYTS